jgi:signal transduction histidine kinase
MKITLMDDRTFFDLYQAGKTTTLDEMLYNNSRAIRTRLTSIRANAECLARRMAEVVERIDAEGPNASLSDIRSSAITDITRNHEALDALLEMQKQLLRLKQDADDAAAGIKRISLRDLAKWVNGDCAREFTLFDEEGEHHVKNVRFAAKAGARNRIDDSIVVYEKDGATATHVASTLVRVKEVRDAIQ